MQIIRVELYGLALRKPRIDLTLVSYETTKFDWIAFGTKAPAPATKANYGLQAKILNASYHRADATNFITDEKIGASHEVVHKAIAQLAGAGPLTPVAFSTTRNWVISRLLRDLEYSFDASTENEASHPDPDSTEEVKLAPGQTRWEPLRVSVFEVDKSREPGVPIRDWIWFCGIGVILVQLVVSTVPWIRDGEWGPFIVTGAGTVLALISGSLSQFRKEKWACPRDGGDAVILTRGNGSRHAVLILRSKVSPSKSSEPTTDVSRGLDFEILAEGSHLLGIGLLGSIQNVIAASAIREPGTYGVHLKFKEKITGGSVREILKATEEKYEFAGLSLVDIFFPGSMRVKKDDEIAFWREVQDKRNSENAFGHRIDSLPRAT
ncbi:hypothetical protein TWF788_006577 [Orbilia oligospora]|uniref:Uncharacterized protein n=1 Tax=Orbilia oligospora TaxID=2813651 RepID=A0A7C8PVS1_ORBOL|nr:hypothetical protein TWF788_006577 [Orbilia oligospora]